VTTIAKTNFPLYRTYLLKEQLREVFATKGTPGKQLHAGWLSWATRPRPPSSWHWQKRPNGFSR
jgi:hypothetical protein